MTFFRLEFSDFQFMSNNKRFKVSQGLMNDMLIPGEMANGNF